MDTIPAPLKGEVTIIPGGSRAIGAALVRKFAENGCSHVAITYNTNKDLAEKMFASIRELTPKIKTCAIAGTCWVASPQAGWMGDW